MEQFNQDFTNLSLRLNQVRKASGLVRISCLRNLKAIADDHELNEEDEILDFHLKHLRDGLKILSMEKKYEKSWKEDTKKIAEALNKGELGVEINKPIFKSSEVPKRRDFWKSVSDDCFISKSGIKITSSKPISEIMEHFKDEDKEIIERQVTDPKKLEPLRRSIFENKEFRNQNEKMRDDFASPRVHQVKHKADFWINNLDKKNNNNIRNKASLKQSESDRINQISEKWKRRDQCHNSLSKGNVRTNNCRRLIRPNAVHAKKDLWNYIITEESQSSKPALQEPSLETTIEDKSDEEILCDLIYHDGEQYEDGTASISVTSLFKKYVKETLIGVLEDAKLLELVDFDDEILGKTFEDLFDEDEVVVLLKPIFEIQAKFEEMRRQQQQKYVED